MNKFCGVAVFMAGLMMAGCGQEQKPAAPAASASSDNYLGAVVKAQQTAVKQIDTVALNQQIQLFNAQEGRNPKDLDELVSQHYIGKLPAAPVGMKLVYDPALGKVSVVKE